MPKKMTNRYDRIRGQTSAGTDRSVFIASSSRKAAALSTTVHTAMSTKAACVCRRSLARSRCPQQTENSAPLPHAQAEQDGRQERHERIGRADRAERVRAKKPADDERVRYIIKLLQQVPQIMGNAKRSSVLGMEPVVRSICAKITVSFSYSGEF